MSLVKKKRFSNATPKSVAGLVGRLLRERGLVPETKYYNTAINDVTVSGSGLWIGLVQSVSQGDTAVTRDGNRIAVKSIEVEVCLGSPVITDIFAVLPWYTCKLALVLDKQPNGADPTMIVQQGATNIGIYMCASFGATYGYGAYSTRDTNGLSRFTVISERHDNVLPHPYWAYVDTSGTSGDASAIDNKSVIVRMRHIFKSPIIVQYDATGGGVADVMQNNLGICVLPSATEQISIAGNASITFTDC